MKKPSVPQYLSARQAAGELGVSLPTLYAYVSRGHIRSEPDPGSRGRRYRGDDVRAMSARRLPAAEKGGLDRSALAWGAPIVESAITCITEDGPHYRGVSAVDLADSATLEQVATLLWGYDEGDPFAADRGNTGGQLLEEVLTTLAPLRAIDRIAVAMAIAGDQDLHAHSRTVLGQTATGARILRLAARAAVSADEHDGPIHGILARHWAPDSAAAPDLLRRALVLLADHELNASTFTARCAASTGSSLYDIVAAGLAALKGPKHGGACTRAARLVRAYSGGEVLARAREDAGLGAQFPGFGHPLYPNGDPRSKALLKTLAAAGAPRRLVEDMPNAIAEVTGEQPNIDYAVAALAATFDLPEGAELTLFAVSRITGWLAHGMEQLRSDQLIRPRARYTGVAPKI